MDLHLEGRVPARIEDLAGVDVDDLCHVRPSGSG
jgi:hypothetical protein